MALKILKRLRHFRGHGVHSPYVYNIVRDVFMRKELLPNSSHKLLNALLQAGCEVALSIELQNIYTHCRYSSFTIDPAKENICGAEFVVLTDIYCGQIRECYNRTIESGSTLVLLAPEISRERKRVCAEITKEHRSTTIDRGKYILFFNNHLPKQYFAL